MRANSNFNVQQILQRNIVILQKLNVERWKETNWNERRKNNTWIVLADTCATRHLLYWGLWTQLDEYNACGIELCAVRPLIAVEQLQLLLFFGSVVSFSQAQNL